MESDIEAERRRRIRWIVLTLPVTYLLALGRVWDVYRTLPLFFVIGGAIIEVVSGLFIWYVWIPYRVRKRRSGF